MAVSVSIITDTENPNEYDDESFTNASNGLVGYVSELWEAGASIDDIQNVIKDALEGAGA